MRQQNVHKQPVYKDNDFCHTAIFLLKYCWKKNSQKTKSAYLIALLFRKFLPPRGYLGSGGFWLCFWITKYMQFLRAEDKVGGEMALNHIRHVLQTKIGAMRYATKLNFDLFWILKWVLQTSRECKVHKNCGHLYFLVELQLLKKSKMVHFCWFLCWC